MQTAFLFAVQHHARTWNKTRSDEFGLIEDSFPPTTRTHRARVNRAQAATPAAIAEGMKAMTQLSGVLSMFFISMAFLTSCGPAEQPKSGSVSPFVTLQQE